MALQFTRNAKVYIVDTTTSPNNCWQVNVLDGFSFGQTVNSTEITVNEAGATSRRARLLFNDSLAPAEWSFATYVRPYLKTAPSPDQVVPPEGALWAMLVGADGYDPTTGVFDYATTAVNAMTATSNTFNFNSSNQSSFSEGWEIIVAFEDGSNTQYYKLDKAVVNSASIDFDIEGIATIQWSGFASSITDLGTSLTGADATNVAAAITDGLTDSCGIIRNRISTVDLERTDGVSDTYNIVLTGGSFSIENNITYLTPEELGVVNQPCVNITGTRSISGNLTCYLDNDVAGSKSGELFADLVSDTTTVRNVFNMAINIGGTTASTPRLYLALPTAHLEVPAIGVEDLITLDIAFHGQVSSGNVDNTDEATIIYNA